MEGFIQLHRQMLEWEWYKNGNVTSVFIHCLLKANWKDKKWEGELIKRGEFITSYQNLSNELSGKNYKFSVMQVRTALKKLSLTGEITIKTSNKFTLIKVNNYNGYQGDNTQDNNQITNKQQTNNNQITTTNKDNKDNNNKLYSEVATKVATIQDLIKKEFNEDFLKNINNKYNLSQEDFKEQCNLFYLHWSEKNTNGKKERWQMEKTFDPKLRFYKWLSNNKKWNKPQNEEQERKQKLEELEQKKKNLFNN